MAQAKKEVNILCFGDSLTEGYCRPDFLVEFHPYTTYLKSLLEKEFSPTCKDSVEFKVHNYGVSGECVHDQMMPRLRELLRSSTNFDLAIINGGTNDLGIGRTGVDVITDDLIALHELLHKRGIPTVVFTVPQAKFDQQFPGFNLVERRNTLNDQLREKVTAWGGMAVVGDVNKLIPFGAADSEGRSFYDRDGLHFSVAGYQEVAKVLFDALQPLLVSRLPWLLA